MDVVERGKLLTFLSLMAFMFLAPLAALVVSPLLQDLAPGMFWPIWITIGMALGPIAAALYFKLLWPRGYPDVLLMLGITWWAVLLLLLLQEEMMRGPLTP